MKEQSFAMELYMIHLIQVIELWDVLGELNKEQFCSFLIVML